MIMSSTELNRYKRRNLEELEKLGNGTYGYVNLIYDKELRQLVVGKLFSTSGVRTKVKTQLAEARREAKILARFSHKNIVKVLGTVLWDDHNFMVLMEYAPCKDLETLLMSDKEIFLPWKLRARFFTELASALNYLHNHYLVRSCIHGDLKPQNVLLGGALEIKLGDFGAATIAKATGSATTTISGGGNNQHTPIYAAPEYVKNPNLKRSCKMDVYSYAMVGYEIITRQVIYSQCGVPYDLLLELIISRGQKPNENYLNDVANDMGENSSDLRMFQKLQEFVKQCWQFEPTNRPNISDVKKDLDQLAQSEKIYDQEIDKEVKSFIRKRKLKSKRYLPERASGTAVTKHWLSWLSILVIMVGLVAIVFKYFSNDASPCFLLADDYKLRIYNVDTKKISNLSQYPNHFARPESVKQVLKVNDVVYVVGRKDVDSIRITKVNLSDPSLIWSEVEWKEEYKKRSFIVSDSGIYAVGGSILNQRVSTSNQGQVVQTTVFNSAAVDFYNTTTEKWTQMPNMNWVRKDSSLVLFNGMICAIGQKNSECFNQTMNKWTYLPPLNVDRRNAAAVELNGELFVVGGINAKVGNKLAAVEKFNPTTNSWLRVPGLKEPRANFAAGIFNKKIYVIGGGSSLIEAYNPSRNVWEVMDYNTEIARYAAFSVF